MSHFKAKELAIKQFKFLNLAFDIDNLQEIMDMANLKEITTTSTFTICNKNNKIYSKDSHDISLNYNALKLSNKDSKNLYMINDSFELVFADENTPLIYDVNEAHVMYAINNDNPDEFVIFFSEDNDTKHKEIYEINMFLNLYEKNGNKVKCSNFLDSKKNIASDLALLNRIEGLDYCNTYHQSFSIYEIGYQRAFFGKNGYEKSRREVYQSFADFKNHYKWYFDNFESYITNNGNYWHTKAEI